MNRTLLGLPGPWADDEREPSDRYTTKIGGLPDWPTSLGDALKPHLLDCRACGSKLTLVAQIYAPISSKSLNLEERTVYVFGCLMPKCGTAQESWRAFRVQKLGEEKESEVSLEEEAIPEPVAVSPASMSKTNWWDDLDNEDDDDIDLESLSKALAEVATITSSSKKQSKHGKSPSEAKIKVSPSRSQTKAKDDNRPVVPCFYVHMQEERPANNVSPLLGGNESNINKDNHANNETWEEEKYEHDKAFYADRTYLKFKKRLDASPEQCFRYSYGGKPLLATEEGSIPEKCGLCGSSRHYEMQLMPPLIYFLHEAADDCKRKALDNWDWMTLIVYTCSESCSNSVNGEVISGRCIVAEEAITVQYEKQMKLDDLLHFFS